MGLPDNQAPLEAFTNAELMDMGGDMFSVPVLAVLLKFILDP